MINKFADDIGGKMDSEKMALADRGILINLAS